MSKTESAICRDGDDNLRRLAGVECRCPWRQLEGTVQDASTINNWLVIYLAEEAFEGFSLLRDAAPHVRHSLGIGEPKYFGTVTGHSLLMKYPDGGFKTPDVCLGAFLLCYHCDMYFYIYWLLLVWLSRRVCYFGMACTGSVRLDKHLRCARSQAPHRDEVPFVDNGHCMLTEK
jgi:hypothetical protein